MNIELSPEAEKLAKERVERGEYETLSELVNDAVYRLLQISEQYETAERSSGKSSELKPLILLEGSLPSNWKDDIY